MIRFPTIIHTCWRRHFGRYEIDDPRPIADSAPYTYFLPSENELLALQSGDLAKIVFRSIPGGHEWDVERMWVIVGHTEGDALQGTLDNIPDDMPQLRFGDLISFRRSDVIDIVWSDQRVSPPPSRPCRREYWDRCMVDDCVLSGLSGVDYIYRDLPDMAEPGDKFPDSGWRIRGTDEGIDVDEKEGRTPKYVAVGAVLNRDDSWLSLIDEPHGSRFIRDLSTGAFVPTTDA